MPTKLQSQMIHPKKLFKIYQTLLISIQLRIFGKILKDAIQHGSICPENTSDLRVVIAREWKIISGQKLLMLCHSMPTKPTEKERRSTEGERRSTEGNTEF
jgi:hypothetical protein